MSGDHNMYQKAKPKGQYVVAAQARIGHFADFRGL